MPLKKEILNELLEIPDISVQRFYITPQKDLVICAKSTKEEIHCHKCGKVCDKYGMGQSIRIRHLPIFGHRTYIEITPPRGICHECSNGSKKVTTSQKLGWCSDQSKVTKGYEQHLLLSLINSTIQDVSIKEDVGYTKVVSIIDRYIGRKIDWGQINQIGLLGLDEVALKKGYKDYVTIVTSKIGDDIKILGVIKGHNNAEVKEFLRSIPNKLRKTIKGVCTDMHDGFIFAAKEELSNAMIIIDRFHVAKTYRACLKTYRMQVLKQLKKKLSSEKYAGFKDAIQIVKNNKNGILTDEEKAKLNPLFRMSPGLKKAFSFCRKLTNIFNSHIGTKKAEQLISEWISEVEKSELTCYNSFIKTLRKYKNEIINYFRGRKNSGFMEGINNKIKVMKRRCYGIFNLKHFFQRLVLDVQGYALLGIKTGL